MDQSYRFVMGAIVALLATGPAGDVLAKGKKAATKSATATSPARALNACGCYAELSGRCICSKRGKCDCPGECEPKGCEDKRARQMQKEVAAETKKAAEADKKARQAEKERLLRPEPEAKPKPADKGAEAPAK